VGVGCSYYLYSSPPVTVATHVFTHHQQTKLNPTQTSSPVPPTTYACLPTQPDHPANPQPAAQSIHERPAAPAHYTALTNADGRVTSWAPADASTAPLADVFRAPERQAWSLTFQTGEYFAQRGVEAFFPEVVVRFLVGADKKGEHYHVPVLAGPFGYTTYRGS
jgi:5-hydroxyisourate hydrolase